MKNLIIVPGAIAGMQQSSVHPVPGTVCPEPAPPRDLHGYARSLQEGGARTAALEGTPGAVPLAVGATGAGGGASAAASDGGAASTSMTSGCSAAPGAAAASSAAAPPGSAPPPAAPASVAAASAASASALSCACAPSRLTALSGRGPEYPNGETAAARGNAYAGALGGHGTLRS